MNDKKNMIKMWSCILIITIIIDIFFFIFTINSGYLWAIIVVYPLIVWDIIAFVYWVLSFNLKYKKVKINNNEIEIYAGFCNHYIKVNGEIKDEYKSGLSFTPIKLSCLLNDKKLEVTISTSNYIVVKLDDELVK